MFSMCYIIFVNVCLTFYGMFSLKQLQEHGPVLKIGLDNVFTVQIGALN